MWKSIIGCFFLVQTILAASPFVVQLKNTTTIAQFLEQSIATALGINPTPQKTIKIGNFQAFVKDFEDDLVTQLFQNPLVHDIFPNLQFNILDGTTTLSSASPSASSGSGSGSSSKAGSVTTQNNAPRHLSRLSSREGLFDFGQPFTYKYTTTGKDVTAYVIDTGIAIDHPEFQGRASYGVNYVNESDGDLAGHGTHVAGLIGSKTYGAAKDVSLVEVKVLNSEGSGSLSDILKGIEWANNDRKSKGTKAVANLSLGSFYSAAINDAVNEAVKDGLSVVVAAGNSNANASFYSPASAANAVTVGALDDRSDTIAAFSNYGPKVDVFASGVDVESLDFHDFKSSIKYSGTSMASPIIAGFAATLLEQDILASLILSEIVSLSTKGAISNGTLKAIKYRDTPNRIAYNGVGSEDDSGESSSNKKVVKPSGKSQDDSLLKFVKNLDSTKPKSKFQQDLMDRSAKKNGVDFSQNVQV